MTLDSLEREAKAQRDLLETYLAHYRDASRTASNAGSVLPDVRIVTQAAPSVVPASPKTALILGAVGIVALALQVGAVLFGELMSGRAVYDGNSLRRHEPELVDEPVEQAAMAEVDEALADEASVDEDEADLADMPEPVMATITPAAPAAMRPSPRTPALSLLAADLALGRARIELLLAADMASARDAAVVADALVSEALAKGLSVCRIDAGSGRPSRRRRVSPISRRSRHFGDVVQRVARNLAEVPWGQAGRHRSPFDAPVTLVEALADIYEVVIVSTGRVSINTSLPVFAGVRGRLVIVRQASTPEALVEAVSADAASIGFETVESVVVPEPQSAVA